MEKLFKIIITLCLALSATSVFAQDNYYVFKTEGTPLVKTSSTVKPLYKANAVSSIMTVVLNRGDVLQYINEEGNLYRLDIAGSYKYPSLKNFKQTDNNTSVTKKYFKYVWESINNELSSQSEGGAVVRSENRVLKSPVNGVKVIIKTVKFKWNDSNKKQMSYLFLKEIETNNVIKLGTEDNKLTLFVDSYILKPKTSYQWAVSGNKTTKHNDLEFQDFKVASSEEAKNYAYTIKKLSIELKKMGFKDKFIKKRIIEDYNIYY